MVGNPPPETAYAKPRMEIGAEASFVTCKRLTIDAPASLCVEMPCCPTASKNFTGLKDHPYSGGNLFKGSIACIFLHTSPIANGTGATWPFGKLSASQETLRLQSPFGNPAWERADPRLIIQKTGLFPGQWKIGAEDVATTHPIVFSTPPWKTKMFERKLKELGYEVRPRTRALTAQLLRPALQLSSASRL